MTQKSCHLCGGVKIRLQAGKTNYTQEEAARALGVSAIQFQLLVVHHLVEKHALGNLRLLHFGPSDLLLLRMLTPAWAPNDLSPATVS